MDYSAGLVKKKLLIVNKSEADNLAFCLFDNLYVPQYNLLPANYRLTSLILIQRSSLAVEFYLVVNDALARLLAELLVLQLSLVELAHCNLPLLACYFF